MNQTKISSQWFTFQKNLFENSFNALSRMQDRTEQMTNAVLNRLPWVPEEGLKAYNDSIETFKQMREKYKNDMDESFTKAREFFNQN